MSIPGDASPLLLGGGAQQYKIERSLRFNSSDSAYLSRTPASNGTSFTTWTWSMWVKRATLGTNQVLFSSGSNVSDYLIVNFESGDVLRLVTGENGASNDNLVTTSAVFRDVSAWYHFLVQFDTSNATQADRIKIYVNGVRQAISGTIASQGYVGTTFNRSGIPHNIGRQGNNVSYFSGYLADIHFIDGQALDPTSFAETNITTGQWVPKAYTGTYGTNGFRLAFADNSNNTATTLGKDSSPNGNNWTPNNLSVTAGAGNDSLVDTPTSYGTDTGAGGSVRGNYCTWNPLKQNGTTLSNGNLDASITSSGANQVHGTIGVSSGKWYWEVTPTNSPSGTILIGVAKDVAVVSVSNVTSGNAWLYYGFNGQKFNTSGTSYGATYGNGDVIGVALDLDAGTLTYYKNGTTQGQAFSGISGTLVPLIHDDDSGSSKTAVANFGQRQWAYQAPAGFKALCDTNLPAPVVAKPNTAFDVKLYTGNGSSQTISGLGFSPDLVWIKSRSDAYWHELTDIVRGVNKPLFSNSTSAEGSYTNLTAFNSDGFTVANNGTTNQGTNANGTSFVAWTWDAGSSTATNTQGSITSQVRANASAGFSIVSYSGSGSSGTIGHGLGVAPAMIITKCRTNVGGATVWGVWHKDLSGANPLLRLNATSETQQYSTVYQPTNNTSQVWGVGDELTVNAASNTYIAYVFATVAGYSSFGSYTGNGSADGPFVYTGFRPRWILVKCSSADDGWVILDSARDTYNLALAQLIPNLANAEDTSNSYFRCDFLSNGFKLRTTGTPSNSNGGTYIFFALAESPFQYARAR